MANSSFQKTQLPNPLPVNKGGTGTTSLTDKGVIVGAGASNPTFVSPGSSGNFLKSDGTNWVSSSGIIVGNNTVSYSKLATDLTQTVVISANDVDWSLGAIYTKTLTSNTTFTFSNYKTDKIIVLKISGDFTLSFPSTVNIINGVYDGKVVNYITLHCTKNTSVEEVWAMINQRMLSDYGYGYFAGGDNGGTGTFYATTDRIVFSSGVTSASTASNLSVARFALAGLSDCGLYGYFGGGGSGNYLATTDRIVFSTGATGANTVSNLSQARQHLASLSDSSTYGYFAGGYTGTYFATTDRIIFSTGVTSANTVSNITSTRMGLTGVSDALSYGYFAGGVSAGYFDTTDRIVFSSGITSANTVSNLSQARAYLAGISDSSSYGYFSGGSNGGTLNTSDRIVFSTGVTGANTVSNLSTAKYFLSGMSDGLNYGYFGGGMSSTLINVTDRMVFSTGVATANTVSNLSLSRRSLGCSSSCSV